MEQNIRMPFKNMTSFRNNEISLGSKNKITKYNEYLLSFRVQTELKKKSHPRVDQFQKLDHSFSLCHELHVSVSAENYH